MFLQKNINIDDSIVSSKSRSFIKTNKLFNKIKRKIKKLYIKYLRLIRKNKYVYSICRYLWFVIKPRNQSSVSMIIGDCGSGKTSYAVRLSQKYLKKGYKVYSNMFIKNCYQLSLTDLMTYDLGKNSVVILDEASSTGLASRGNMYKDSNTPKIIEFFTMYRHYQVKKVLVLCPSFSDIIPVVRANSNKIILIKRSILNNLGIGKFKCINKRVDIPNDSEPKEQYCFVPFYRGFYFQYATFGMYDTYSKKELKNKKWKEW